MKRWLSGLVIFSYITVLSYGVVCHSLSYRVAQHPMMYFIIWDMFCGWSAYADATKIVAQGESGTYYELSPPPWGEIVPYGSVGRHNYDNLKRHFPKLAENTLRHTQHEPIDRIFVIEEIWPKKFDLPEPVWNALYDSPKDAKHYYRLRAELNSDCEVVRGYSGWHDNQAWIAISDNPRLVNEARNGQSFFMVDQGRNTIGALGSPKGN